MSNFDKEQLEKALVGFAFFNMLWGVYTFTDSGSAYTLALFIDKRCKTIITLRRIQGSTFVSRSSVTFDAVDEEHIDSTLIQHYSLQLSTTKKVITVLKFRSQMNLDYQTVSNSTAIVHLHVTKRQIPAFLGKYVKECIIEKRR